MGISVRYYLFPDDGSLRRVPQRIAEELPHGSDAIPEFAGTRQRIAQVVIENENGRPVRIYDARGLFWDFDADGKIDEDLQERLHERLNAHEAARRGRRTAVVDLVPEIKRRELDARDRWTLTADDLDRIAADLWPGVHGPVPEVSTVKGTKPRKPKLTFEAKHALEKLATHVMGIRNILTGLSEKDLKGLAFEAIRTSTFEDEEVWRGIGEDAKRREAIRTAHRTGKGEWYAVLEVARAHATLPYLWEQVTVAHEKRATRDEAVEIGRLMMIDKAGWLDGDIEIQVNIRSALEWRPEEWG